jgi:2-iminobutanoate/2-iminopropanoate deaminase
MSKVIVHTDEAPKPSGAYSQAVKSGGLVFVAGQAPIDPITGKIVGTTIQEQTAQSLRNVTAILRAAGSSLEQAVSATFILADPDDFAGMNEEWTKWFPANGPARQGARHPLTGVKISIALIAEA